MSDLNNGNLKNIQGATVSLSGQELKVQGNLVFSTVSGLLATSNKLLKNIELGEIFVNLSEVDKIDSAGVALLVEWNRFCQQQHKPCEFTGLKGQAVSLIETYKLTDVLQAQ